MVWWLIGLIGLGARLAGQGPKDNSSFYNADVDDTPFRGITSKADRDAYYAAKELSDILSRYHK